MLSELADILAAVEAESVDTKAVAGPEVAMGAITAAVHLLQWDQHVVSTTSGKMAPPIPLSLVALTARLVEDSNTT